MIAQVSASQKFSSLFASSLLLQAESDLSVTAIRIKEDAVALSVREAQLKQGEEKLKREKQEFERRRCGFDDERDRIGKLGLEVQKRSREIEELCLVRSCVLTKGAGVTLFTNLAWVSLLGSCSSTGRGRAGVGTS